MRQFILLFLAIFAFSFSSPVFAQNDVPEEIQYFYDGDDFESDEFESIFNDGIFNPDANDLYAFINQELDTTQSCSVAVDPDNYTIVSSFYDETTNLQNYRITVDELWEYKGMPVVPGVYEVVFYWSDLSKEGELSLIDDSGQYIFFNHIVKENCAIEALNTHFTKSVRDVKLEQLQSLINDVSIYLTTLRVRLDSIMQSQR